MKMMILSFLVSLIWLLKPAFCNVKKLNRDINSISTQIIKIRANLNSLDKKLAFRNSMYVTQLEKLKSIEKSLDETNDLYQINREQVKLKLKNIKKALLYNELIELKRGQEDESLIVSEMMVKKIKLDYNELKRMVNRSKDLEKQINELDSSLEKTKNNQQVLYSVLSNFENQKNNLANQYFEAIDTKKRHVKSLMKIKLKKELGKINGEENILAKIILPVTQYNKIHKNKKGLKFNYAQRQDIRSVLDGTIDYVGELSTYGNVIVINHGNDVRSVYLGKIKPSIQKNSKVSKGQSIGELAQNNGELYFEVRKNDRAVNMNNYYKYIN